MDPQKPQLRDEIVALRPWRDEDVPTKFAGFSHPSVQRFSWPGEEPYTEVDAWAHHRDHARAWEEGTAAEFACVDPADDAHVIGGASVYDIDAHARQASIGYWVAPDARGK